MEELHNSVAIKNDAVMGKQPMTLQEAKLLRIAITNVSKYDTELMEYYLPIKKLALILGVDESNLYEDIRAICVKLSRRTLEIKDPSRKDSSWTVYPWMSEANYDASTKLIKLCLNEKIKDYVLQLDLLFTKYKLKYVLSLNSYYAIRIYEILISVYNKHKKMKKSFEFSVQELREMTGSENKNKQISQFKERVLDIAVAEINKNTDLVISYKTKKTGRTITHIVFSVDEVIEIEYKDYEDTNDVEDISGQICGMLDEMGISNTMDQCEQLSKAYNGNIDNFKRNLDYVVTRLDINNFVAYLIVISKNIVAAP